MDFNEIIKNFGFQELFNYILMPLLTIYGIYRVKKSKIFFIEKQKIKLYDDIIKNIEGLSIVYNNSVIKNNLIYVKYTIYIDSVNDIKIDEIDKELTIYSHDENSEWKYFHIINNNIDENLKYNIIGNKVSFNKCLLKSNDHITFVGLIETTNKKISLKFRIYNILKSSVFISVEQASKIKFNLMMLIFTLVMMIASVYYNRYVISTFDKSIFTDIDNLYDYKIDYYQDDHLINIDKKIKNTKYINDSILSLKRIKLNSQIDSLKNIYIQNSTIENENILLKKAYESFDLMVVDNNYELIESQATNKLRTILNDSLKVDTTYYKLNDSLNVKFINKYSNIEKSNRNSLGILYYFIVLNFLLIIYYGYEYYEIRKMVNKIDK